MVTKIVLPPMAAGLSATTHTATAGVPSVTEMKFDWRCRITGSASGIEIVSLDQLLFNCVIHIYVYAYSTAFSHSRQFVLLQLHRE